MNSKDVQQVDVIPTRCVSIDRALGVGGLPRGRICEIFGPESSGKTTLTLETLASAQQMGLLGAFIDVEHALDPIYAAKLGVDIDKLLISQPDYAEQALEITSDLIDSGQVGIVIIDSVAALVPKAELDGEMGDTFVGIQARLMSQAMRKLTGMVAKKNVLAIFVNQIREKINMTGFGGDPTTTSGGRALKFYSSIRIDMRYIAQVKEDEVRVANRTKVKVVKNKLAAPFREAEVNIVFGKGFDKIRDVIELGSAQGTVEKSGSWYSFKGERLGQGISQATDFLELNLDIYEDIKRLTIEALDGAEAK